jgi:hypothetical protein
MSDKSADVVDGGVVKMRCRNIATAIYLDDEQNLKRFMTGIYDHLESISEILHLSIRKALVHMRSGHFLRGRVVVLELRASLAADQENFDPLEPVEFTSPPALIRCCEVNLLLHHNYRVTEFYMGLRPQTDHRAGTTLTRTNFFSRFEASQKGNSTSHA